MNTFGSKKIILSNANTSNSKKLLSSEANTFDSKKIIYKAKWTRSTVLRLVRFLFPRRLLFRETG